MSHWAGTSENAIIRELAEKADLPTRQKVEQAMSGEDITFALRDNIVYDELYIDPDNVFNVMLSVGYLTAVSYDGYNVTARIPNKEVHKIFTDKIQEWFRGTLPAFDLKALYSAFEKGMVNRSEELLTEKFLSAMSYYDSKEAFYHGILLTLMQLNTAYFCSSNRESGSGRFDIQCKQRTKRDLRLYPYHYRADSGL